MSRAPLILDLGKGVRGIYSVAIFQKEPYGKRRALFCCHNPECRNSLCTIGGREQLRRRPPPAAETGSRSRGRGPRGGVPPKGSRPMRAPQPVRAGRESPRGVGKKPRRCGGRGFTVTKDSLTQSVGLFFIAVIRDKENAAGSRSRSTGLA